MSFRDVRCVQQGWHGTRRYHIQFLATHASTCVHRYSSLLAAEIWTKIKKTTYWEKKNLNCSFHLYRYPKYVSYGFPIINFCNPVVHYETPCSASCWLLLQERIPIVASDFLFSKTVQISSGSHPASYLMSPDVLSLMYSGWCLKLTSLFHTVPKARVSGTVLLLSIYAFMAATGTNLPFLLSVQVKNFECLWYVRSCTDWKELEKSVTMADIGLGF
jgi:hypothetical protein